MSLKFNNEFEIQPSDSGGGSTLITKNITENGTYNASSDNADGYSKVIVNVSGQSGDVLSIGQPVLFNSEKNVKGYVPQDVYMTKTEALWVQPVLSDNTSNDKLKLYQVDTTGTTMQNMYYGFDKNAETYISSIIGYNSDDRYSILQLQFDETLTIENIYINAHGTSNVAAALKEVKIYNVDGDNQETLINEIDGSDYMTIDCNMTEANKINIYMQGSHQTFPSRVYEIKIKAYTSSGDLYPDFVDTMVNYYNNASNHSFVTGINATQTGNGVVSSDFVYTGIADSYLTFPSVAPLSTAETWEFKTKFVYTSGQTNTPALLGSNLNVEGQGAYNSPLFTFNNNRKILLWLSSNGTSWDISNGSYSNQAFTNNGTYFVKIGFTGSKYYVQINQTGWSDNFTEILAVSSSAKVVCTNTFVLCNNLNTGSNAWYGSVDMKETSLTINGTEWWSGLKTTQGKKHTNGLCFYSLTDKAEFDKLYNITQKADLWGVDTTNEVLYTPRRNDDEHIYYAVDNSYSISTDNIIYT